MNSIEHFLGRIGLSGTTWAVWLSTAVISCPGLLRAQNQAPPAAGPEIPDAVIEDAAAVPETEMNLEELQSFFREQKQAAEEEATAEFDVGEEDTPGKPASDEDLEEAVREAMKETGEEPADDDAPEPAEDQPAGSDKKTPGPTGLEPVAHELDANQRIRRREFELMAEHYHIKALNAYRDGEFRDAVDYCDKALEKLSRTSMSEHRIVKTIQDINQMKADIHSDWAQKLIVDARELVSVDKIDTAIQKCRDVQVLDPARAQDMDERISRYNQLKRDIEIRAITTEEEVLINKQEILFDIEVLMEKGHVFYENRRFTDARDSFEQVLLKDPYYLPAIRALQMVNEALNAAATAKRHNMVQERLAEVHWKWSEPVTPAVVAPAAQVSGMMVFKEQRGGSWSKLQDIILPKVQFEEMPVEEVVKELRRLSVEHDPDRVGVNLFLQLNAPGAAAAEEEAMEGYEQLDDYGGMGGGYGEEAYYEEDYEEDYDEDYEEDYEEEYEDYEDFGGEDFGGYGGYDEEAEYEEPGMAAPRAGPRLITMDMDNIPLGEVIKYICLGASLKYKVEKDAVILADRSVPLDEMETRFYPVEAGVLKGQKTRRSAERIDWDTGTSRNSSNNDRGSDRDREREEEEQVLVQDLTSLFRGFGVDFPAGSNIAYYQTAGKLVVNNTPENLRQVEKALQEISKTPPQVTIEAKFVEVDQTEMDTLGFDWMMTAGGSEYYPADELQTHYLGPVQPYNPPLTIGSQDSEYQFGIDQDTTSLSNGMRLAHDFLSQVNEGEDRLLGVHSILGNLAFETVVHALKQKGNADILSSPKVTTLSGNTAVLRMVETRHFPDSWSTPQVSSTGNVGGTTSSYTPSIPNFGSTTDVGVVLNVTPIVAGDGYSIDLELEPQVVDFVRYDADFNYTMIINNVEVEAKALMPILAERTVETRVIVWDGETVVLGGMIRERVDTWEDKVPVMGDIPVLGRLFTSTGNRNEKINLLIFVTARIVDPSGHPIRRDDTQRGLHDFRR